MPGKDECATGEWSVSRVYENDACSVDTTVVLRRDVAGEDGEWSERLGYVRLRLAGGVEGHLNELLLRPAALVALRSLLASADGQEMVDWVLSLCDAGPAGGEWGNPSELLEAVQDGQALPPSDEEDPEDDDGEEQGSEDDVVDDQDLDGGGEDGDESTSRIADDDVRNAGSREDDEYGSAANEELIKLAHCHWDDDEVLCKINGQFMSEREPESWLYLAQEVRRIQSRLDGLVRSRFPSHLKQDSGPDGVSGLQWPSHAKQSRSVALKSDCYWYKDGLLSFMGYHVGESSSLSSDERRRILDYVLTERIPNVNDPAYMAQWGEPGASRRLRKMAESLAHFARSAKRNPYADKTMAISEWESDLAYLRQKYHRLGTKHTWQWPSTGRS